MACALTQGYSFDCRDSIGGLANLWIIEFDNVSGITETSGTVTAIAKANGGRFYKYNLTKNTAEATETFTDSRENGTSFYAQSISFVLNKMQVSLRNEISLIAQNRLLAIVEDKNGNYWLYGRTNGLMREGGTAKSGINPGDRNGYEITLTGEEKNMAYAVSSGIIAALTTA